MAGRRHSCDLCGGKPDDDALKRIDVSLRLGNAPAPRGLPDFGLADEYITYAAKPKENAGFQTKRAGMRAHGVIAEERAVFFADILAAQKRGARVQSKSPIPSAATSKARSSSPWPAKFMSWRKRAGSAEKCPPNGSCRIFEINNVFVFVARVR